MSTYTTLANVKSFLNVTTTTDDALLTRLIAAASGAIEAYCNRNLLSAAYSETRNGNGRDRMPFANYPVSAVSAVTIKGVIIPAAPANAPGATLGSGYSFDANVLYLSGYSFYRGVQNVSFSYTAGLAATPPEVEQVCIDLVALRYVGRDRIGQVSKAIQGVGTTTFARDPVPPDAKLVLDNYKRVGLVV